MKFIYFIKSLFSGKSCSTALERKINYKFQNKHYLDQAFTHKSLDTQPSMNYESLEFLGQLKTGNNPTSNTETNGLFNSPTFFV